MSKLRTFTTEETVTIIELYLREVPITEISKVLHTNTRPLKRTLADLIAKGQVRRQLELRRGAKPKTWWQPARLPDAPLLLPRPYEDDPRAATEYGRLPPRPLNATLGGVARYG